MDTKTLFRNLVTGTYVSDFDYSYQQFTFQTVFHISLSEYCCCSCSYEHEFLEYIHEDGDIDENIYTKTLESIINGKCPHVDGAPSELVTETSVYGIHIASVVGPLRVVKRFSQDYFYKRGKIFELDPCQTAILKNRGRFVDVFYKARVRGCSICNSSSFWKQFLLTGVRREEQRDEVSFEYQPMVLYCAKQNNYQMTKTVLNSFTMHNPVDIGKVLELSYNRRANDLQGAVISHCGRGKKRVVESCAQVAILYDHSESFAKILDIMSRNKLECDFSEMFSLFESKKCRLTFDRSRYRHRKSKVSVVEDLVPRSSVLVDVIDTFPDFLTDELMGSFKKIVQRDNIDGTPDDQCLSLFSDYINTIKRNRIRADCGAHYKDVIHILSRLGANIDHQEDGQTPLTRLLHDRAFDYFPNLRKLLELLIYENSSTELNPLAVSLGIKCDESHRDLHQRRKRPRVSGNYVLNARMHSLFGHNAASSYALNFLGPFLGECGYPVKRRDLLEALEIPSLHQAEKEYYEHALENPRSLQFQCRNRLRQHFRGREIHTFVQNAAIPEHIGQIILLKPLLKAIYIAEDDGV